jgi:DNA-binding MarR family transcriptional regulator
MTAESGSERSADNGVEYTPAELARAARRFDMAAVGMHLETASRMGMTQAELLAIEWLGMDGDLGPTELAHRLHIRTGAVTALLDRLDRRKLLVRLTGTARSETMALLHPMIDDVMELARGLTTEDRRRIGAYLDALAAIVASYAAELPPHTPPDGALS